MPRLIVTADIHGKINILEKILATAEPEDALLVAGDLFDTVYGSSGNTDFNPEAVKNAFEKFSGEKYYVYGNCDDPDYYEGWTYYTDLQFQGKKIFMAHGNLPVPAVSDFDIIIEGHTHIPVINTLYGKVFLNPGSPARPRNSFPSYAVIDDTQIALIHFESGKVMDRLTFSELEKNTI